ncbi:MAG: peptidoglycan bridge formation glycyltransferase FemA/FemB family protein [Candidatus Andersenbacteria bacterium]
MEFREVTDKRQWNDFVLAKAPNTFLQSWEWGQIQQRDGEKVRYLGWFDEEQQVGASLLITVKARRGTHLFCPHGPIGKDEVTTRKIIRELVQQVPAFAREDGAVALRIAPLLETTVDTKQLFKDLGFRPSPLHVHAELTWVKDISADEESLLTAMRKTTRHAIKKAQKEGVTVEVVRNITALDRFWPLYIATKNRHEFVPFPKEFIAAQFEEFMKEDRAFAIIARYNNEDVAAAVIFQFGSTSFYYHGASTKLPASVPAAQLLQWEAIREAKHSGATRYNFWGIAPDDQPNHPFAGITTFKKGFGGKAVDYLHAQDLPLSPRYWKLWAIDTYRRIRRGF